MRVLLFSSWKIEILEERDYPEDPAPYLRFALLREDAPPILDFEEAEHLARALTEWLAIIRHQDATARLEHASWQRRRATGEDVLGRRHLGLYGDSAA